MGRDLPEYLTLCMICGHAPDCALLPITHQPVWTCDAFVPAASAVAEGVPTTRGDDWGEGGEVASDLCSTCRRRGECRFPRGRGGIWHCAAYH